MRFTVKADLLQFADFFGHCISVREFDAGAMFTSIPVPWTDDRVHVYCLSRFAREVWFRGQLMGIIELEPKR
jgi:hypothetical protein